VEGCFFEIANATVWQGMGETRALHDFSLTLNSGESVAILGPNGAGKSTLLKLLSGELRPAFHPDSHCRLFGEEFWDLDSLRRRIGLVMPEEVARFAHHEEAFDVVLSSLRGAYGRTRQMRFSQVEKEAAAGAIARVGMASFQKRPFGHLSSGERRRFLIARALVHEPEVMVLDEPSTALDFPAAITLGQTLRTLMKEGQTLVWVTHDPAEIPPEVSRCLLLKEGRLFADGAPRQVLTSSVLSELYEIPLQARWREGWCQVRGVEQD
jgi:iron complex transport system ATP-binding protein